jgi:hypothetical protein
MVMLDWMHIAGAMFGDVGFTVPLGGLVGQITNVFRGGGKMIHNDVPINTTISAILVLRRDCFARREMMVAAKEIGASSDRKLFMQEFGRLYHRFEEEGRPSVLVVENPHAANNLPRSWFRGPYDERAGLDERGFGCIFVGTGLESLEKEEKA